MLKNISKTFLLTLLISGIFASLKSEYIKLVSSDIQSTVMDFNLDDFNLIPVVTPEGTMNIIKIKNGASFLTLGAPDLQKISKSIIIPDNGNMSYRIISSEYKDYTNILIAPSKGNISRSINPNEIDYQFGPEYSSNSFFPSSLIKLQNPYILKDLRGQTVDFHPFQYNAITKTLRVYDRIIVEITNQNGNSTNILNRKNPKQLITREYKNIYENHFLNFSNDNRFEYLEDRGNMLIISYGPFIEEMQPFVNWKNKKGIPTEIINVADIGTNATVIKNYIDSYYYENGLTFLLLVGDVAQIPTPTIGGSASDPSYGFIDGNDSYAEVIVGRFSGSTPTHIATQVARSIEYERYPQSNADWYDNAMGVASNQGPGWGGLQDDQFNDMLWDDVLSNFTYDSYQYSYDGSGSVTQGLSIINNGVSLINYTGHGSISGWGNGAAISTSNVNSLNNENLLPFVISVACNVGEFNSTNECFAESWLRATNNGNPTGGIGHMGSTISMSWEPPMHGQYAMNLILTESYEGQITRSMGGIATNGCLYMNDAQGSSGTNETNYWTLFGDPSLELRTDQPSVLNVSHDGAIVVGQSELIVNTGANNSLVAISKDNELLAFAYSNDNGYANLNLDNANLLPGDYDLVVTSFNSFPYETVLSVITPEGPYITFDSYLINDGFSVGGNDNGIAEFDEEILLSLNANNVGVDNANNVYAQVTIDDIYINLINGDLQFGNITPGNSAEAGSINFSIAHNVPDGHMASFNILFYSNEGQWEANFNLPISAPLLTVSNPSFIDDGGDGVWDAGEAITLTLLLNNEGSASHYSYPGIYLSEESNDATISEGLEFFWFYGIESGTSVPATFVVTASDDANMGTEVTFIAYADELNCEGNCITSEAFTFTFTIGLPIDDSLYEPLNLVAEALDDSINLTWDEPFTCPEGQFADCIGQCIEDWYESWLGDGLCDDGTWGVYFNCEEFNNDNGDCGDIITCEDQGLITCPNGTCENSLEDCPETSCDPGYVVDCADDDCCPESWIGDGYADCEDQAYGCDLTCYDNDGGDCGSRDNPKLEKVDKMYPSRSSDVTISQNISRDAEGYFIFRDGIYIAYSNELEYNDTDILGGMEYCYQVSAIYDEGQSEPSNSACATAEGSGNMLGDLNTDGTLNVLDIIIMANMALGTETPNYNLADLNNDGIINILDIIGLVNLILNERVLESSNDIGKKATIYKEDMSLYISADGNIAGIQMDINTSNISINKDIPMEIKTNIINGIHRILIYGINGETLSGKKIQLFKTEGKYDVESIIVGNIISEPMLIEVDDRFSPTIFQLNQNYPNPFNPKTLIKFSIAKDEIVSLNIFDINGRLINSLIEHSYLASGYYDIHWDGTNSNGLQVPSGMYIYKLISKSQTITKKMVLMK